MSKNKYKFSFKDRVKFTKVFKFGLNEPLKLNHEDEGIIVGRHTVITELCEEKNIYTIDNNTYRCLILEEDLSNIEVESTNV